MGIQINGNTDNISATDGGLTVSDLEINQSGISTFNGNIDANGDLDVDGHTNLDNVSIAGVTTFSGVVKIPTVAGTNTNAALNVLFQTSAGVIDGGSGLTYNPAGDSLSVNGNFISNSNFRGSGALGRFSCNNHSSTTFIDVSNTIDISTVDNTTGAFTLKQGSNEYITVDTTNSSELIKFGTAGSERVRITSLGRVSIGDRTTNPDELVHVHTASGDARVHIEGASDAELKLTSHSGDSTIFMGDSASGSIGSINYDHAGDDFIFTAGGNARGRIYDNAGVTGIEHHRFIPFLIGYDIQNTSNITMTKGFGGMSRLPMNGDGDKAYMSYVTHWRHREYALVRFWYGASGNTSGATFDWDFTVWNASSGQGYSASSHTFTVTSGTMSNGKMYGYNILSSWPTHGSSKFVQFEIEYDELQGSTSLQLAGLELVEYTTT